MNNIITAQLRQGETSRTLPLWQYDYGMILLPVGVELPDAYEVHFANIRDNETVTSIGNESGVSIPDSVLLSGKNINAYIYLHTGEDDGETVYHVVIPVNDRAQPTNETPTPVQQDVITQTIAALNAAVEKCETNVSHYPHIVDGYWYCWDANEGTYANTNVPATGPQGQTGPQGPTGPQGQTGPQGDSAYVHIRYASHEPTQNSDMKTTPDNWMGVYSGHSATAPTSYTSYAWNEVKGDAAFEITDDNNGNVSIVYEEIVNAAGVDF